MLISASRRTDIPAFYSDWLVKRIHDGYVITANPVNPRQIRTISLSPDTVDGFVFWTKNPLPMLEKFHHFQDYAYYFQFTMTPYGHEVEPNIPPKDAAVTTFRRLADLIGPERVVWRYDPIFLNNKYTLDFHKEAFALLCNKLNGYSNKCVFSFVDDYRHIRGNMKRLGVRAITESETDTLAGSLAETARTNGMTPAACAEEKDLSGHGVWRARCVDARMFVEMTGRKPVAGKDKNQRAGCGCDASVDIGTYQTCRGGCLYCYANHSREAVRRSLALYDQNAPALCRDIDR